jgi:hypothetical protein
MVEGAGMAEYFGMAEGLGIIVTMFIVSLLLKKTCLAVDIETKSLNDLDERIHGITRYRS